MNIFVTNDCPSLSAQALDDKRIVKMVLESAQLLSTAIFINTNTIHYGIYKPTHLKHPCSIWAASSIGNWDWLFKHFIALCDEYMLRYNKVHSSSTISPFLLRHRTCIKNGELTIFTNCTRSIKIQVDFRDIPDTCEAYRYYLNAKWQHDKIMPKWTNRKAPIWYTL